MPSENKTNNYGLNQWQGNEYLKREDLNTDNEIIDVELKNVNDKADSKISRSLATTANQFLLSSAVGQWAVKTIDEIKSLLGLGSAAYTNSNAYATAAQGTKADNAATQAVFNTHLSDTTHIPHLGTTTNSGNAYSITTSTLLKLNSKFTITFNAASTGPITLTVVNQGGATPVYKAGNIPVMVKAGTYTLFVNNGNFQLLGEGGEIPKLPNLIKNGSFVNGTNGWASVSNISASNSILTLTAVAQWGSVRQQVPKPTANDKIYMRCELKGALSARLIFYYADGLGLVATPIVANTWQTLSASFTCPSNMTMADIAIDDSATSGWAPIQITKVMFCNLTQAFGAGNEPSKEEMDAVIQKFGWWDSDLPILTADGTTYLEPKLLSGAVAYSNGYKVVGTMPNKTFSATGGAYTGAVGIKTDGVGSLCVQPSEGYYKNEVNAAGFGPILIHDPNFIPSNILAGKSIFGLAGSYSGVQKQIIENVESSSYNNKSSFYGVDGQIIVDTDGHTAVPLPYVTVAGSTKKPSIIILINNHFSYDYRFTSIYHSDISCHSVYGPGYVFVSSPTGQFFHVGVDGSRCYVTSTGFRIPVGLYDSNYQFRVELYYF